MCVYSFFSSPCAHWRCFGSRGDAPRMALWRPAPLAVGGALGALLREALVSHLGTPLVPPAWAVPAQESSRGLCEESDCSGACLQAALRLLEAPGLSIYLAFAATLIAACVLAAVCGCALGALVLSSCSGARFWQALAGPASWARVAPYATRYGVGWPAPALSAGRGAVGAT